MSNLVVKRALISVYHKDKIVELAKFLKENDVEIISSFGTHKLLEKHNIKTILIDEFVGYQEKYNGIIKSLFPFIFASILSKRDNNDKKIGIKPIDLVVVNFYPYEQLAFSELESKDSLLELIDIGGPALLRAASKNYKYVCPVCSPDFYKEIIDEIKSTGVISLKTRKRMAIEVFKKSSNYDRIISETLK